jgi:HEAT repeat protein
MALIEKVEETLRLLLADASPEVRAAASGSFDTVRARRAAGSYLHELKSGALEARVRVVYAAGGMGGGEGVSLLLAALSDPEPEVRAVAARELASHPAVPVLKAIVERLPKEKGVVLANLIDALGASRRRELSPVIERYLADPDPEVRGRAIVAYARVGDGEALDKVMPFSVSPVDNIRAAVAQALGEWSGGTPPHPG